MTVTDILRKRLNTIINSVSNSLLRIGFSPNSITLIGLIGTAVAAVLIARGLYFFGGMTAGIMGVMDAFDGTMARISGKTGKFGCLFDSVIDRYSESALLLGFLINFTYLQNSLGIIMVYFAICGSLLVSYIRARAEGLGLDIKIGIMTRVERLLVLVISLLAGFPFIGVTIVAVLANVTAVQRFLFARSTITDHN